MSNKLISLLLVACMLICLTACMGSESEEPNGISTDHADTSQGGEETERPKEVSLVEMTSSGEISYDLFQTSLTPHAVSDYYDSISPEWFPFRYKSTYGYADANGKVMIANSYEYAGHFTEGKAVVQTNDGRWHIINSENTVLLDFPEDVNFNYRENLFFRNGNLVAAQQYQSNTSNGSEMRLKIIHVDSNLKLSVSDIKLGESRGVGWNSNSNYVINTDEFKGVMSYYLYGINGLGINVYDLNGNVVCSYSPEAIAVTTQAVSDSCISFYENGLKLTNLIFVRDGYINVANDAGLWGLMNINTKEMLIDYKYDYLGGYSKDPIVACRYGKWGCIDATDKTVIDFQFSCIQSFSNGKAFAVTADKAFSVINSSGEVVGTYSDLLASDLYCHYANEFNKYGVTTLYSQKDLNKTYTRLITDTGKVLGSGTVGYLSDSYVLLDKQLYRIDLHEVSEE